METMVRLASAVVFLTLVSIFTGCGQKVPQAPDLGGLNDYGGSGYGGTGNTGNTNDSLPVPAADPYFSRYIDKFIQLAHNYGNPAQDGNISVSFGDTSSHGANVIGYCQIQSDGTRFVIIKQNFWNAQDTLTNESLLFHELGHCILNRAHQPNFRPEKNLWPVSLMNPYIVRSAIYGQDQAYYQQELFTVSYPKLTMPSNTMAPDNAMEMEEDGHGGCVAHVE